MSISKDSFKLKVLKICDKWYFSHDQYDQLVLWEKPFTYLQGAEPYPVAWWEKDHVFTWRDVEKLRGMHMIRLRGLQMEVVEQMTGRNKKRQEANGRRFHHTNKEIFKLGRNMFKKDRDAMGVTSSTTRDAITKQGVAWDDSKKVVHKLFDYAEKHAAGEVQANHPHVILGQERKVASGAMPRELAV